MAGKRTVRSTGTADEGAVGLLVARDVGGAGGAEQRAVGQREHQRARQRRRCRARRDSRTANISAPPSSSGGGRCRAAVRRGRACGRRRAASGSSERGQRPAEVAAQDGALDPFRARGRRRRRLPPSRTSASASATASSTVSTPGVGSPASTTDQAAPAAGQRAGGQPAAPGAGDRDAATAGEGQLQADAAGVGDERADEGADALRAGAAGSAGRRRRRSTWRPKRGDGHDAGTDGSCSPGWGLAFAARSGPAPGATGSGRGAAGIGRRRAARSNRSAAERWRGSFDAARRGAARRSARTSRGTPSSGGLPTGTPVRRSESVLLATGSASAVRSLPAACSIGLPGDIHEYLVAAEYRYVRLSAAPTPGGRRVSEVSDRRGGRWPSWRSVLPPSAQASEAGATMVTTTRRLSALWAGVSLGTSGRVSAKPLACSRSGSTWYPAQEEADHGVRPGAGELPVVRVPRAADRCVVGVPLDGDGVVEGPQLRVRSTSRILTPVGQQDRLAGVVEHAVGEADLQPLGVDLELGALGDAGAGERLPRGPS